MEKPLIKQRRKPVQSRSIARFHAILDASSRVLEKHAFERVTMSEIVLESEQPYATIYQYFSSKEDIYYAWLERLIDRSLGGLTALTRQPQKKLVSEYIESPVRYALAQLIENRQTLLALFSGMPLTAPMMAELMESKTLLWMEEALGSEFMGNMPPNFKENLLTAIRVGNGYWLQEALNHKRDINIERESMQFAAIIRVLLSSG